MVVAEGSVERRGRGEGGASPLATVPETAVVTTTRTIQTIAAEAPVATQTVVTAAAVAATSTLILTVTTRSCR